MMTQEILEAIKKSLPEVQMSALREELSKAASVEGLVDNNNKLLKQVDDLRKEISIFTEQLKKHDEISKRIEVAKEAERNLEIERLKYQLQAEKNSYQNVKDLMFAVFKNVEIREHIYKQVPNPHNINNTYDQTVHCNENRTVTKE